MENDLRIQLDWANMMAEKVGEEHGITQANIEKLLPKCKAVHDDLMVRRQRRELAFYDLPFMREVTIEILAFAEKVQGKFENYVHVGIGGSSLGPKALHRALNHPFHNLFPTEKRGGLPRMFFPENIDPDTLHGLLGILDVEKTLFNIVTKSGATAETIATFLVLLGELKRAVGKRYREHLVFTTDPTEGDLRKIAEEEGIETFSIHQGVGGRFSVLTPVGILPAALVRDDVDGLLRGAAKMAEWCTKPDVFENPAYLFAVLTHLADTQKGKPMVVMMPYADSLADTADWFRQLWAESLGKKHALDGSRVHVGPTPIKALGAVDQHSQIQLFIEGPFDKIIVFIEVEQFRHEVAIPAEYSHLKSFGYLGGQTINKLIAAEKKATEMALTNNHRPNMTIKIPKVTASTMGQFFYLLEVAVAFAGGLYGVNPFDQPGVEEGKRWTQELMAGS